MRLGKALRLLTSREANHVGFILNASLAPQASD